MRLATQTRALTLCQSAPDAVTFTVCKRVLETIKTHAAIHADSFCRITGAPAFGKEEVRILCATQRTLLPVIANAPHALPP